MRQSGVTAGRGRSLLFDLSDRVLGERAGPQNMRIAIKRRLATKRSLALGAIALLLLLATGEQGPRAQADPMLEIKEQIRAQFPDVSHISAAQLQSWLAGAPSASPLLLDARTLEEFEVSHMRDARFAPSVEASLQALAGVARDQSIIAYCAVGFRSSVLARGARRTGLYQRA